MPNVIITARYFAVDPEPLDVLQAHGCTLVHTAAALGVVAVLEGRRPEAAMLVNPAVYQ